MIYLLYNGLFFCLNIGAGDAEVISSLTPLYILFSRFNVFQLFYYHLNMLIIACLAGGFYKLLEKIIKRKNEYSSELAFVPFITLGTISIIVIL